MEPSRDTAGRRRREMLALARRFEDAIGLPDQSRIVYTYPDGWTIRHVQYHQDQEREGHLLKNCLRFMGGRLDDNCWSLRDQDNLPHLAFACWYVGEDDDLSEVFAEEMSQMTFVRGTTLLLMVDTPHGLKDSRRSQLLEFANADLELDVSWFPTSRGDRIRVVARGHNVVYGLEEE